MIRLLFIAAILFVALSVVTYASHAFLPTSIAKIILIPFYDELGAAISMAVPLLIIHPFFIPRYCCKQLNYSLQKYWINTILRAWLTPLVTALLYSPIAYSHTPSTWLNLLAMAILLVLLYLFAAFYISFNSSERLYWLTKIGKWLPIKQKG